MSKARRTMVLPLIVILSLIVPFTQKTDLVKASSPNDRRIYVQYHLWYTYGDEQLPGYESREPNYGRWHMWSQTSFGLEVINGVPPTNFITPWRRVTTSRLGLPLVGLYSSGASAGTVSEDVIRYHFELAKQAGIDGMFASVYDDNWKGIFGRHLDIAGQVGMKLGLELFHTRWGPDCTETEATQIARRTNYLTELLTDFSDHPAYVKVDNLPVVWIANAPECNNAGGKVFTWGNKSQLAQILNNVQANVGNFYIVMVGPPTDNNGNKFSDISQILKVVTVENIGVFWGQFGYDRQVFQQLSSTNRQTYENAYQSQIDSAKNLAGDKLALHVYPAFDERGLFPTNRDRLSGISVPRTVIGRDGNGMYASRDGFLKAALDKAASNNLWVFLESWNDWAEQTQIEPGFHFDQFAKHGDYFSALRRIAEFKGMNDVAFSLPSPNILDAPLRNYCLYKEWGNLSAMSKSVKLQGTFGFASGANAGTNGVAFSVSYLDTDNVWKSHALIQKQYTGSLRSFNIDITPIINKPAIVFGIEALGDPSYDWAYLTKFKLNWHGQEINLLNNDILSNFYWHSQQGPVPWGSSGPQGTAKLAANVTMENGVNYSSALYLHPDWYNNGFVHAGLDFDAIGTPKRVKLAGTFGFASGANAGTNGVAFSVSYLDDDRSYQDPSYEPATKWKSHALIEKQYTGSLKSFNIDITPILNKPAIVFGIEALGDAGYDWAYLTEFKLNWYGQEINLLNNDILSNFYWHSQQGPVPWGSSGPQGTAKLAANVTMENGVNYSSALYLHPDWYNNGFVHSGLGFWTIAPYINTCQ